MLTEHTNEARHLGLPNFKIKQEYEAIVTKMPEAAYNQLKESIRADGQFVPITVNQNYIVLDGHHRLKACKELGIAPKFELRKFESEEDEIAFVIKCNLHRRHMITFERIEAAYKLEAIEAEKARKRRLEFLRRGKAVTTTSPSVQNNTNEEKGRVIDKCAKAAGVSATTYNKGRYIIQNALGWQKEKLRNRELSIDEVYHQLAEAKEKKDKPPFQEKIVQLSNKGKLIHGDFRTATDQEISSKSIDLIIPSSTILKFNVEECAYLLRFAEKTLKLFGALVLKVDQKALAHVMTIARKEMKQLRYFWLFVAKIVPDQGRATSEVDSVLELYLVFTKGFGIKPNMRFVDFIDTSNRDRKEPTYYHTRIIPEYLISHLSQENDVVCDPMCGFGFTGKIALRLKRQFIGIEAEAENFRLACSLLADYGGEKQ